MTFSSLVFLCIFMPTVFLLHCALPSVKLRNALLMFAAAVLLCAPVGALVGRLRAYRTRTPAERRKQGVLFVLSFLVLLWCLIRLSGGSYNPFIYFRF